MIIDYFNQEGWGGDWRGREGQITGVQRGDMGSQSVSYI